MLPPYLLALHQPPPAPAPTLTVTARGRVYPSKALLATLRLRAGQPVDLLPPSPACPLWQLDLRPQASRRISWHANTRPRIESVKLPAGLVEPSTSLTLALATTNPTTTGLYPLRLAA